ncbi:glycerophosphodiester phosphodiesterase [Geobacillus sp. 46C-IIa]|uniref:glycerophosphodiester phosphodiesterase family protein n=1 Tax=Geobacillus sp. 46C-IIa TaxID=1963025 RepID=UPI0009BFDF88|nr:glycerophosphodiester phosphodiesterase family protein [Geobacillus sp. 46C-IIa]OQP07086.1 glycerophosphodiester phosphodiesterase [Geobacillus sp. 46C-IIa]QNU29411.1 glycerophosphodiester phosphodiesterase [Geobacillus sp. 46C-IIa]
MRRIWLYAGFLLWLPLGLASSAAPQPSVAREPIIIAHRGASGHAPEHTLASYRLAGRMHADYIEVDVRMTKDGKLIAMHDATLARTTNAETVYPHRSPWHVGDFSLAELKRLDAGSWFSKRFAGEPIPTLEDIMRTLEAERIDAPLYIELKQPGIEKAVVQLLQKHHDLQRGRIMFQSFHPESLQALRPLIPRGIPLIQLIGERETARIGPGELLGQVAVYADGIGLPLSLASKEWVDAAHSRGLIVHVYTVNDTRDLACLCSIGVDGLFTDYPDRPARIAACRSPFIIDPLLE